MIMVLKKHIGLAFIYLIFFASILTYIYNKIRYHNVEAWASVPAGNIVLDGKTIPFQISNRTGSSTTNVNFRSATFSYQVYGKKYRGDRISPDGNQSWVNYFGDSPKTCYHPENPEIAVIFPIPYVGTTWLVVAVFSGLLVAIHLMVLVINR